MPLSGGHTKGAFHQSLNVPAYALPAIHSQDASISQSQADRNDLILHRSEWQTIANTRIREATTLRDNKHWSGAYYLAGYALECGLKACLTRQFKAATMPDKQLVTKAHTHDLETLVRLAGLDRSLSNEQNSDPEFAVYWATVKDWSEASRYKILNESEAVDMIVAVKQRNHGVMKWVRANW